MLPFCEPFYLGEVAVVCRAVLMGHQFSGNYAMLEIKKFVVQPLLHISVTEPFLMWTSESQGHSLHINTSFPQSL